MEYTKFEQRCLNKICDEQEKLCNADNNHRYILALHSLKFWLERFSKLLHDRNVAVQSAEYEQLFIVGIGSSFYERVNNSIVEYNYGTRPF